jgi:acyl-[acyl-carrier-protein]-phospholipid O-acyltransferase/long-chain-fatty-acid--[acyl-carrier-protein] ligase
LVLALAGPVGTVRFFLNSLRFERRLLLSQPAYIKRYIIVELAHKQGLGELALPRQVLTVERIPLLGTGKIDYLQPRVMAEELLSAD